VIFLLLLYSCFSGIHGNVAQSCALNFKSVQEENYQGSYAYEPGKELYPGYLYEGLPENFAVKKSPDLSLTGEDIELVGIKRNSFSPPHISTYIVTIHLKKESAERMRTFTETHLNKKVAMEIDGKIVKIATIMGIISHKLSVAFTRTSLSEIEDEFKKVTGKIRIINVD
jgi:preprotein translocase subunit SecD